MTTGEAILVLAPLLAPVAAAYGYDKMIFGLIMIFNLEIGYLHATCRIEPDRGHERVQATVG